MWMHKADLTYRPGCHVSHRQPTLRVSEYIHAYMHAHTLISAACMLPLSRFFLTYSYHTYLFHPLSPPSSSVPVRFLASMQSSNSNIVASLTALNVKELESKEPTAQHPDGMGLPGGGFAHHLFDSCAQVCAILSR